jgi:hypothetical protein
MAVMIKIVNEDVPIDSIRGQDPQHEEVRNHHQQVKGIRLVDAAESAIGEFAEIVRHRIRRDRNRHRQQGMKVHFVFTLA